MERTSAGGRPSPRERRCVELYVDDSKDSWRALDLLREEGYLVITFPVRGNFGPELRMDSGHTIKVYLGLDEIRHMVSNGGV